MRLYEEGGWTITTPVYLGSAAEVKKAQGCRHPEYGEISKNVDKSTLFVMERCKGCVATRSKFRPAKPEEIKEQPWK